MIFSNALTRLVVLIHICGRGYYPFVQATLLAIREAREKMYIGIRESEAGKLIRDAITSTGLKDAYALTLLVVCDHVRS